MWLLVATLLVGCDERGTAVQPESGVVQEEGTPIVLRHAKYLTLSSHPGYVVARLQVPGAYPADGSLAVDTLVLAPADGPAPPLDGALRGATLIRTPVQRIASNAGSDEAFLTQLGVEERLVAVGGLASYDDGIRRRALSGEIGQIGYNWHSPPNLDVLLAQRPDVFLMRVSDPSQTPMLQRARKLGIAVVPTLAEEEQTYLGRAEWIRLYGLLTGSQARADALFAEVEARVATLKAAVAARPRKQVLWAYPNGADRWVVTVRGADNAYITDAGGTNLLAKPEDVQRYSAETMTTEALLPLAEQADVWLIGDLHAVSPRSAATERSFRAWREGRLFANTGRTKAEANAYDWYQTGLVRPDWVLGDFVKALHPDLVPEPFQFLKPLRRGEHR